MMEREGGYRKLRQEEITVMEAAGCTSSDWSRVRVTEHFDAHSFRNVAFSGDVCLGLMSGTIEDKGGSPLKEGIYNAAIHNCSIGDHSAIHNIGGCLSGYRVGSGVVISDCGRIFTEGESSFGNGTEVAVLNETGARSVRIWDRLSSQLAYAIALYRHRRHTLKAYNAMVDDYCDELRQAGAYIGNNARIRGCLLIRNVRIGEAAVVEESIYLSEGSINSSAENPVDIGAGVIMENFIVSGGSEVSDAAILKNSFVGEACRLGRQFTAGDSLFFANCEFYQGEATSVFAGPFTVSHHKSTLLIAGLFSFMNAGSGSNQSNHLYKLGPIHKGILERGSKTGSDSYILWPARVGAFTLVTGRHYGNADSSKLPFSYLVEKNNETVLIPGINLRSVGTIRDARKWPGRERRKAGSGIDIITYDMLSPYTVGKMIEGRRLLRQLADESEDRQEYFMHGNMKIGRHALERGIALYDTGIIKYLGTVLADRLLSRSFRSLDELRDCLRPGSDAGSGEWIDMGGMIMPALQAESLLSRMDSGMLASLDEVNRAFAEIAASLPDREWEWVAARLEEETGLRLADITVAALEGILSKWKDAVISLDYSLYEDAIKEFTLSARTGFGIDGDDRVAREDFEQVRGSFESNPFVQSILEHIRIKSAEGDELTDKLDKLQ